MFIHLAKHPKILVTGIQRSGTAITARMIAHDTGHQYIDEQDFYVRDIDKLSELLNDKEPMVIHCPAMSYIIHEYGRFCIVWVNRPLDDIKRSQAKIAWGELKERTAYNIFNEEIDLCEYELNYWQQYQRPLLKTVYEVEYNDLKNHVLWVEDRTNFTTRQWK